LHDRIDVAAKIWNHCINLHKQYDRFTGKHLEKAKLQKHITKLKKRPKYAYWNQLGSQSIQDVTDRIERGYQRFFKKLNKRPPRFRKIKKHKSFTLKQAGYKLFEDNRIQINSTTYKYFKSREIEGTVKTVTVKRDSLGDIYIFIVCDVPQPPQVITRAGKMVGYDFGLSTYLKASDGNDIESPLFFEQNSAVIKKLNRELSRKVKGSNHRKQARLNLARAHKKTANQRKDFQFKLAYELCGEYALICIEDLNIKAMQRLWGKKISDLSHSNFVKILKYAASRTGTEVIKISRWYPSSKTCSTCGHVLDELPLKIREWQCLVCKTKHDRDFNAAINILREGASSFGLDTVRPASVG
jgi:putative transposase